MCSEVIATDVRISHSSNSFFKLKKSFFSVLDLCCCRWTFSSCVWGFSCCGARILGHAGSVAVARCLSCLAGMWGLPRPEIKPVSPALAGLSTPGPPGKSQGFEEACVSIPLMVSEASTHPSRHVPVSKHLCFSRQVWYQASGRGCVSGDLFPLDKKGWGPGVT